MKLKPFLFCSLLLIFFFSCKNNSNSEQSAGTKSEYIFCDYKISAEEGYDKLTFLARFRYRTQNGNGLKLIPPAKVQLDGETLPADSSGMNGFFYEIYKPIDGFAGDHSITFTDFGGQELKQAFRFEPMILLSELPETLNRGELVLELGGVDSTDNIRVLLTDTSFVSDGINKVGYTENGKLRITAEELSKLATGPVHMELIKESDKFLNNETTAGGRLRISYTLRRSFELSDKVED